MTASTVLSQEEGLIEVTKIELAGLYAELEILKEKDSIQSQQLLAKDTLLATKDSINKELNLRLTIHEEKEALRKTEISLMTRQYTLEEIILKDKLKSKRWAIGPQAGVTLSTSELPDVKAKPYIGVGITYMLLKF